MISHRTVFQRIETHAMEQVPVPDSHVRIGSDTSAGRVALIETVEVPGMEPPYHRHLEAVPAGSAHWVPCGTEYTFAVVSPQAYVLTLFLPAGFEQFYTELGAAPWSTVERMIGIAARYAAKLRRRIRVRRHPTYITHRRMNRGTPSCAMNTLLL